MLDQKSRGRSARRTSPLFRGVGSDPMQAEIEAFAEASISTFSTTRITWNGDSEDSEMFRRMPAVAGRTQNFPLSGSSRPCALLRALENPTHGEPPMTRTVFKNGRRATR